MAANNGQAGRRDQALRAKKNDSPATPVSSAIATKAGV
jgi:hypothetical protein